MFSLKMTIQGFHMINPNPIVERNWEEIFVQANFEITQEITYKCGHQPYSIKNEKCLFLHTD